MYHCLCENGKIILNECDLNSLRDVVEFVKSLIGYEMIVFDFDSLIQIRKFERWHNHDGVIERVLVTYKNETVVIPYGN